MNQPVKWLVYFMEKILVTWDRQCTNAFILQLVNCVIVPFSRICRGKSEEKCLYRLQGVVEHLGTMRGGHYVAYIRGSGSVWYHVSDACVREVLLEEVLRCDAYILFYELIWVLPVIVWPLFMILCSMGWIIWRVCERRSERREERERKQPNPSDCTTGRHIEICHSSIFFTKFLTCNRIFSVHFFLRSIQSGEKCRLSFGIWMFPLLLHLCPDLECIGSCILFEKSDRW